MSYEVPVEQTETALRNNNNAATSVTNYAQAAITAVPRIPNPPDWFAPMEEDLKTAQSHADNWLNTLCPAVTTSVPQQVIDFNETFQQISGQILTIQKEIERAGTPTAEQRQNVGAYFDSLTEKLSAQEQTITSLQSRIKAYFADVENDQDKMTSDLAAVAERFADGQTWIQKLRAAIGENFLDSNALGPCSTIVEVNMNVTLQIGGIGADPTLITLVFAQAILQNQFSNQGAAEQAVQSVLDSWTTFKAKTDAVISDLKDASDSRYLDILSESDLVSAQTQWRQLSNFAAGLLTGSGGGQEDGNSETMKAAMKNRVS